MQTIRRAGYLLALILAAAFTTAFAWRPAPPPRFAGLGSLNVPRTVSGFSGQDEPVDAVTKAALNSAQVMARSYRDPSGREIDLDLIGGTDRSALHDPRSCLVGAGWKIDNDRVESLSIDGKEVPARTCTASLADPSTGEQQAYDILYLYVTHRRVIASATQIRLALLESAMLDQNDAPVYFIRLMTPLPKNAADARTEHDALTGFAAGFWKQISPSIMKGELS